MNQTPDEAQELRRYWLGELAPADEVRLEARYFADDELLAQLEAVRTELLDAYVRSELSAAERARCERTLFAALGVQQELPRARAFLAALNPAPPVITPDTPVLSWWTWPRWGWGLNATRPMRALVCALVCALIWLSFDNRRLRRELTSLQSVRTAQEERTRELTAQLAQLSEQLAQGRIAATPAASPTLPAPIPRQPHPQPAPPMGKTLALALGPIQLRDAGPREPVLITPDVRTLECRLLLEVPEAFQRYDAVLWRGTTPLQRWRALKPVTQNGSAAVRVPIPVARLTAGVEYRVQLFGLNPDGTREPVHSYTFQRAPQ